MPNSPGPPPGPPRLPIQQKDRVRPRIRDLERAVREEPPRRHPEQRHGRSCCDAVRYRVGRGRTHLAQPARVQCQTRTAIRRERRCRHRRGAPRSHVRSRAPCGRTRVRSRAARRKECQHRCQAHPTAHRARRLHCHGVLPLRYFCARDPRHCTSHAAILIGQGGHNAAPGVRGSHHLGPGGRSSRNRPPDRVPGRYGQRRIRRSRARSSSSSWRVEE